MGVSLTKKDSNKYNRRAAFVLSLCSTMRCKHFCNNEGVPKLLLDSILPRHTPIHSCTRYWTSSCFRLHCNPSTQIRIPLPIKIPEIRSLTFVYPLFPGTQALGSFSNLPIHEAPFRSTTIANACSMLTERISHFTSEYPIEIVI